MLRRRGYYFATNGDNDYHFDYSSYPIIGLSKHTKIIARRNNIIVPDDAPTTIPLGYESSPRALDSLKPNFVYDVFGIEPNLEDGDAGAICACINEIIIQKVRKPIAFSHFW